MLVVILFQIYLISLCQITKPKLMSIPRKKQSKSTQIKQQIVVCPNCQHHFKVIHVETTHTISKTKNISNKDIQQNFDKLPLQNSRESNDSFVYWKQIPISPTHQQTLIFDLRKNQMNTIQKLKILNDINELKKSRLLGQQSAISQFPEVKKNSPQKYSGNKPLTATQESPVRKLNRTQSKNMIQSHKNKKMNENQRQADSQCIIQQGLQKQLAVSTLDYLLQWIQGFGLMDSIPSFIKATLQEYSSIRKNGQHSFCPSFKY